MAWLLSEFEDWLKENEYYDADEVKRLLYWQWSEDHLSTNDLENFLVYMACFAAEKVFGGPDARLSVRFIPFAGEASPSSITIIELKTRTVLAYLELWPANFNAFEIERVLDRMIRQLEDSKKLLAVRVMVEG